MLYKIEATSIHCYNKKDEGERILKRYPCLDNFGFRIGEKNDGTGIIHEPFVELYTLDELNELMFELNEPLVLTPGIIEIYDTYRE